jgi:pimeloyl-ACP methyl ester carboxylesterase
MTYEAQRLPWREDIHVRGLRYRLTWWGERTNDPIVLLHGFLDSGATWQFLVDHVPSAWTLVAPDWRGFGDSEWAPGGYWFPDYFADLEVLLDTLVPESRARVVGHSMGANIAEMYGGIRPKRLRWLVNLEGLGLAPTQPAEAPKRYAQWLDEERAPFSEGRYASVAQLASVLRMRNPRLGMDASEFIAGAWSRPVSSAADSASSEVRLRFDPRHRMVNPILYRREEAEACWARLEVPMLLVIGEVSDHRAHHTGLATDERLHELFRNLRIVTVAGAGHMMHHEDPASVAKYLIEFERDCAAAQP